MIRIMATVLIALEALDTLKFHGMYTHVVKQIARSFVDHML
jgi:hypothetical protein